MGTSSRGWQIEAMDGKMVLGATDVVIIAGIGILFAISLALTIGFFRHD